MKRFVAAACLSGLVIFSGFGAPVSAGDRKWLGFGHLMTNDNFITLQDRWRTGSYMTSYVFGPGWGGAPPRRFGEIIELRIGGEIIAPADIVTPAAGDRPYASALSLGLHSHFRRGAVELAMGADLVVTGPQVGFDRIQGTVHDIAGIPGPSAATLAGQIGNGVHPTAVIEAGRNFALGGNAELRPFVEARWGAETLLRAGADLTFGRIGSSGATGGAGELLIRDPVTGQRYRAIAGKQASGLAFVLGGDISRIESSIFLPAASVPPEDWRTRLRAGLHWQGKKGQSLFYGVTWMSPEFTAQPEGQLQGSVGLKLNF